MNMHTLVENLNTLINSGHIIEARTQALEILENHTDTDKGFLGLILVRCSRMIGDYEKAIDFAHNILKDISNEDSSYSKILVELGNVYRLKRDYSQAIINYENVLITVPLNQEFNVSRVSLQALWGIGVCHRLQGEFRAAQTIFESVICECEIQSYTLPEAHTRREIGVLFRQIKDFDNASTQISKALSLYINLGFKLGEAHCYRELGNLCRERDNLDEAEAFYKLALQEFSSLGTRLGLANTLLAQGFNYFRQEKFLEAESCYLRSRELFLQLNDCRGYKNVNQRLEEVRVLIDS